MKNLETLFRFIKKLKPQFQFQTHFQISDPIAVQILLTTAGSSKTSKPGTHPTLVCTKAHSYAFGCDI